MTTDYIRKLWFISGAYLRRSRRTFCEKLETFAGLFIIGNVVSMLNPVAWLWAIIWFIAGAVIF